MSTKSQTKEQRKEWELATDFMLSLSEDRRRQILSRSILAVELAIKQTDEQIFFEALTKHQEELTELRKDLHKMSKFLHQKKEKKKEKEKK